MSRKHSVWASLAAALPSPLLACMILVAVAPAAKAAAESGTAALTPPNVVLVYSVIAIVLVGTLIAFAATKAALAKSSWSLADALSEEADVTFTQDSDDVRTPKFDDNMKPIMVTELCASSSRLIAFVGLIAILMMFMGFGVFVLYFFAMGSGIPPGLDQVSKFLLAGMTMFAPYIVNKFASVFDWVTPNKNS
jgi:hypothetical protein